MSDLHMLCAKCGKRPATSAWTNGGALDLVHGFYERRCEPCVIEEQLTFARERAAAIPELERRLKELTDGE